MIASGRLSVTLDSGADACLPARVKSPLTRYEIAPGCSSTIAGRSCKSAAGALFSITIGATANGPARPAAQAMANLILNAINIASSICLLAGRRRIAGALLSSVGLRSRDFRRRLHLGHQVVVPLAFDLEVGGGAELDGLDQVVRDVGVDTRLLEGVECRARGPAPDEPGLKTGFRAVGELPGFPDVVAVAADQMRAAVAVGLRMHDKDGLADVGRQCVLAGESPDLAVEHDMRRRQLAHQLDGFVVGISG